MGLDGVRHRIHPGFTLPFQQNLCTTQHHFNQIIQTSGTVSFTWTNMKSKNTFEISLLCKTNKSPFFFALHRYFMIVKMDWNILNSIMSQNIHMLLFLTQELVRTFNQSAWPQMVSKLNKEHLRAMQVNVWNLCKLS